MKVMHKEKIGLSLSGEVLALEEANRRRLGFSSRSEFIEAAIREYVGREFLREYSGEIVRVGAWRRRKRAMRTWSVSWM